MELKWHLPHPDGGKKSIAPFLLYKKMSARRFSSPCRFDGHWGSREEAAEEGGSLLLERQREAFSPPPESATPPAGRSSHGGGGTSHWDALFPSSPSPTGSTTTASWARRFLGVPSEESRRQHGRSASVGRRRSGEKDQMFGRRGYDIKELAPADTDGAHYDKRKPEVASDSEDGIEAINLERYALNAEDPDKRSHESLRAAIAAGVRKKKKKYDYRDYLKGWLSMHGLMICKVLLFLFLLTATMIVTILSVRASRIRTEEEAEATLDGTLLVKEKTVIAYTSCGPVQGWLEDGAFAFRGIPYALPPEENLRWKPPVPLNHLEYCWKDTLVTNTKEEPVNSCWQTYRNGSLDGSENCLTVDVFAPRTNRSGIRAPIVVLVAAETLGGGGGKGFVSPQLLTPQLARATGVMFVRVRFRLGILGFFSSSALTKSVHPPCSGNYGLADVRTALEWVKLNAGSFGADESSITVLGHRAGASLVLALTALKRAPRIFSRVWLSGPSPPLTLDSELLHRDWLAAQQQGDVFVEDLECALGRIGSKQEAINVTLCLQNIDAEDLVESVPEDWKWRPVDLPSQGEDSSFFHKWLTVDGEVLNKPPVVAWEIYGLNMPMIIGTTSHGESTAELRRRKNWRVPGTLEEYIRKSAVGAAGVTMESLHLYSTTKSNASSQPLAQLTAMITDIRSICPLISVARKAAMLAKKNPVYFYIAESQPEEAGSGHSEREGEADTVSTTIGPGADLLEILTHPVIKSEEHQGAIARLFYTFVWHDLKEHIATDSLPMIKNTKMPQRLMFVGQDGHVESLSAYHTCEFWDHKGFVSPKFARTD